MEGGEYTRIIIYRGECVIVATSSLKLARAGITEVTRKNTIQYPYDATSLFLEMSKN